MFLQPLPAAYLLLNTAPFVSIPYMMLDLPTTPTQPPRRAKVVKVNDGRTHFIASTEGGAIGEMVRTHHCQHHQCLLVKTKTDNCN